MYIPESDEFTIYISASCYTGMYVYRDLQEHRLCVFFSINKDVNKPWL